MVLCSWLLSTVLWITIVDDVLGFRLIDYTHYLDYLPYRVEGLAGFEDFRTVANPPSHLRNRKMEIGTLKLNVEDVLIDPFWPGKWPYSFEDFRPLDYTRDEVTNTAVQYEYSQSLIEADHVTIVPALLRLPIRRHFVLPNDKLAFREHVKGHMIEGAKVLELFSCYESLLPERPRRGPTVGVGWCEEEMSCNPALDDFIVQDITVDPYLPLASNYFDVVIVPAMYQLFQRPREMFQEINRVLKPGGVAVVGVKLGMWSFLSWKQGRYYVETNYLEDVLALGSFFHFAGGFTAPQAYDLSLPEINPIGRLKDTLFPNPRIDFYACVEARKTADSPHGQAENEELHIAEAEPVVEGAQYKPKLIKDVNTNKLKLSPYY